MDLLLENIPPPPPPIIIDEATDNVVEQLAPVDTRRPTPAIRLTHSGSRQSPPPMNAIVDEVVEEGNVANQIMEIVEETPTPPASQTTTITTQMIENMDDLAKIAYKNRGRLSIDLNAYALRCADRQSMDVLNNRNYIFKVFHTVTNNIKFQAGVQATRHILIDDLEIEIQNMGPQQKIAFIHRTVNRSMDSFTHRIHLAQLGYLILSRTKFFNNWRSKQFAEFKKMIAPRVKAAKRIFTLLERFPAVFTTIEMRILQYIQTSTWDTYIIPNLDALHNLLNRPL